MVRHRGETGCGAQGLAVKTGPCRRSAKLLEIKDVGHAVGEDWRVKMRTPMGGPLTDIVFLYGNSVQKSRGKNRVGVGAKKKLIVSRQPILVNLKSNTMKNTLQNYGFFLSLQIFARKKTVF